MTLQGLSSNLPKIEARSPHVYPRASAPCFDSRTAGAGLCQASDVEGLSMAYGLPGSEP